LAFKDNQVVIDAEIYVLLHRLEPADPSLNSFTTNDVFYSVDAIPRLSPRAFYAALLSLDLAGCLVLACVLRAQGVLPHGINVATNALWLISPAALWLLASHATSSYPRAEFTPLRSQVIGALTAACLASMPWVIAAALEPAGGHTKSWVFGAGFVQAVFAVVVRIASSWVGRLLLNRGYCIERVIVLAATLPTARALSTELEQRTRGRLRVAVCASVPRLQDDGPLLWLESTARSNGISQVLVAPNLNTIGLTPDMVLRLSQTGTDVTTLSADYSAVRICVQPANLPRLHAPQVPLSLAQIFCKRVFDVVMAAGALLVLAPLLLVVAALLRLDSPGPVLFRQRRVGLHGKPFEMFKFRSMYHEMADQACVRQTARNDPRVTRFGRLLRSTSIDELPQLLNVLRGDMSIVGPRPHAIGMTVGGEPVAAALQDYEARHRMKPGITGWAQVNGSRGEVTGLRALRRRVALDRNYIENWSIGLDAFIVLRTISLIFLDKHAF
jgi:exopolysaccharide biosynthesis polyprenyl glycosylphosphotransferase